MTYYFTAGMHSVKMLERMRHLVRLICSHRTAITTERFDYKKPEFWKAKHPGCVGDYCVRHIWHPRRLRRKNSKPYRFICRIEDQEMLRRAGFLVRKETVECETCGGTLRMTFLTTNAKPGTVLEVAE